MFLQRAHFFLVRLLLFCLALGMLASALFAFPALALAASNPITITLQTDSIHFPKSIDFQMSAQDSSATITKAIIYVQYGFTGAGTYPTQGTATITPGHTVTAHWLENTTGTNFVPAGTSVTYYWLLYDSAGNSYTGQQQHFQTVDSRFPWQHLTHGLLQVNWYNRPLAFGQNVLGQANADITHINHTIGGGLKYPINLWVYQTDDDFHGSLSADTHEWVGGIAFPTLNEASIVAVDTGDQTLVRDMPHELTHLIFHQVIGLGAYPPTWFDEGLAVYNQQYHEPAMAHRLQDALNTHSLLPLNAISLDFPANADQAYLAYAQSWNLVSYMYSTFGQPKMAQFIHQMSNQSTDFGRDLELALGVDQDHLENQWHVSLHQPPTLPADELTPTAQPVQQPSHVQVTLSDNNSSLLTFAGIVLILVPLFGIAFIFVNQRRNRQKALAMKAARQMVNTNWSLPQAQVPPAQQPLYTPSQYPQPYGGASGPQSPQNLQAAAPPPTTPQWMPLYLPADANQGNGNGNGNGAYNGRGQQSQPTQSEPFSSNQEYLSQPPRKQAPQE